MNKIGIYYAFWVNDWDTDFVPFVGKVKSLGFDILEVNSGTVTNMSNSERDRLKKAAEDAGIDLGFCIGLTKEYDIASEDQATRKRGIDFLQKQAQMLKYMEAEKLGGIIYGSWPDTLNGSLPEKQKAMERSVASMKEVMKTVEDCNVIFCVEALNRFEQYMMNTCAEALEYIEQVGSPNLKVLLDTFHMNIEEDSFYDAIVQAGDKLGYMHIGETNRRAPGRGRMPWDEIAKGLKTIDFQGSIVMEPFLLPGGQVGRDISVFRDLSIGLDMDAEARRACEFMRKKLS